MPSFNAALNWLRKGEISLSNNFHIQVAAEKRVVLITDVRSDLML